MSKEQDKIDEAAEKGAHDRQERIDNENAAGAAVRGIGGIDIWKTGLPAGASEEEKEAYEDAYYNRK